MPVCCELQHDSDELRPADVSVYVLDVASEAQLGEFERHLAVQATETLHALFVYGQVCEDTSTVR